MEPNKEQILAINAHLKFVEFLLHIFDTGSDELTLKQIREDFKNKFQTQHILLNQNFGVYRLLPIILMKEVYKDNNTKLEGYIAKIKVIRDSIAHNDFSYDENGYRFVNDKTTLDLSYEELVEFVHNVENKFYAQ
jgi:hypothetical protein